MGSDLGLDCVMRRASLYIEGRIWICAGNWRHEKSRGDEERYITTPRMGRGNRKCTLEGRLI